MSDNNQVDMNLTPELMDNFVEFVYERMPESFKDESLSKREQAIKYMEAMNGKL